MKILLADDDRDLVDLLRYAFQRDGYSVITAFDGETTWQVFQIEHPDLVILDLNMPKRNGMDVLRGIRRETSAPVLVLTALGDEEHTVAALEKGADDFLAKPFHPRVLRARVQALLRRARDKDNTQVRRGEILSLNDFVLNPKTREVHIGGLPTVLSRTEFGVLHYLVLNHDIVVSVEEILVNFWGYDADESDKVVKVAISRLRRKLEPDPSQPRYIITVPGAGYMFRTENIKT